MSCHPKYDYLQMTCVYLTIGGADNGKVLQNDKLVWEDRWDMEFNPSECQEERVTSSRNFINTVHGQILEVKYLGVDISRGLSWNTHTDVDRPHHWNCNEDSKFYPT